VIFLAVFFIAGSFTVWWFGLVLLVYLFFVSASAGLTGETIDPSLPKAIRAVGKLFNAKGYEVVPSPTTGNPEYDPLLVGLDFFVQNKEHALAVVVRTEGPQPEDRWEPSDLLRSTWALQLFLQQEPGVTHNSVIPVIVSIGKERTWEEKEVKIMNMPNKELIDKVLAMNSKEDMKELKEIASQYLQFSHEGEDLNAPKDNLNVPGEEI
jgi:hypothetical protein